MKKNKILGRWLLRVVLLILIGFWMSTIWGFSSDNGQESQSLSDKITIKVIYIIEPDYDDLSLTAKEQLFDKTSFVVRKVGHFGEYAILAVLVCCFIITFDRYRNGYRGKLWLSIYTISVGLCYAISDEIHQGFVDGRTPKLFDVFVDVLGGIAGLIFVILISILLNCKRKKNMWEKNIRRVTPYTPGEQPKEKNIIKLNTNECPYSPSPKVAKVLDELESDKYRLYPDPDASVLVDAIAKYHNVPAEQVFVGVGSDDVLGMAFLTCFNSDKPILFPDITYSFYDVWAELFGIKYKTMSLDENFEIKKEDYFCENGGVIFPNPNAPTAIEMPLADIEDIVKHNSDVVVVVDEAYIDFGTQSALPLIDKYDNLLVVRTFSKSRAMAGMRIGYAFGSKKLIDAIKAVKFSYNSYTMNIPSIYAGAAAIEDGAYFEDIVSKIINTREQAKVRLSQLGFTFTESKTNFLFAKHKSMEAEKIFEELKKRNIYVRYFKKPRIDNYLRITIGTDEEMEQLYRALEEIL